MKNGGGIPCILREELVRRLGIAECKVHPGLKIGKHRPLKQTLHIGSLNNPHRAAVSRHFHTSFANPDGRSKRGADVYSRFWSD